MQNIYNITSTKNSYHISPLLDRSSSIAIAKATTFDEPHNPNYFSTSRLIIRCARDLARKTSLMIGTHMHNKLLYIFHKYPREKSHT
jgi:hypothetical protein